jgi:hypothetical protein
MSYLRKALKLGCTFTISMEHDHQYLVIAVERDETKLFTQTGVAELSYLIEFEQLEVAASAALRILAEKSEVLDAVMMMYTNEPCRICGKMITRDDLRGLVFAGYSQGNVSRAAHGECWNKGISKSKWTYPEDASNEQPHPPVVNGRESWLSTRRRPWWVRLVSAVVRWVGRKVEV